MDVGGFQGRSSTKPRIYCSTPPSGIAPNTGANRPPAPRAPRASCTLQQCMMGDSQRTSGIRCLGRCTHLPLVASPQLIMSVLEISGGTRAYLNKYTYEMIFFTFSTTDVFLFRCFPFVFIKPGKMIDFFCLFILCCMFMFCAFLSPPPFFLRYSLSHLLY